MGWRLRLIDGYRDAEFGLLFRFHHSVTDGAFPLRLGCSSALVMELGELAQVHVHVVGLGPVRVVEERGSPSSANGTIPGRCGVHRRSGCR